MMKKIKLLLFILFINVLFIPIAFAEGEVKIKSIELDSKSTDTIVKSEPTFSGLEMNFDLSFKNPSDYAKFKIVIENTTDENYTISEDTSFNKSNYLTYTYEVE